MVNCYSITSFNAVLVFILHNYQFQLYIYIYIYTERERKGFSMVGGCVYIYIYIYTWCIQYVMLLQFILWDDWPIFMISGSNQQLQQELKYTLLKPDCHTWWISKMQSGRGDTLEEQYTIKFCIKVGKKCHRNVWNASDCFWSILHESSSGFWVA